MSHAAPAQPIQAVMLAALTEQFDLLRRLMADADPKVSLRASAEMSKLMGICARNNLSPQPAAEVARPEPPAPAPPPPPPPVTESLLADVLADPKPANRFEPFAPHSRPRPLPPGGKQLASFLAKPAPAQKPPDRGKSV